MTKILHLTLYRKWFDLIALGEKREEYRNAEKGYWVKRLAGRHYDEIHFRNGYGLDLPFMRVECLGIECVAYRFIIKLGKILEIRNWDSPLKEGE